jgi:predicted O-methyltransferase YrrM
MEPLARERSRPSRRYGHTGMSRPVSPRRVPVDEAGANCKGQALSNLISPFHWPAVLTTRRGCGLVAPMQPETARRQQAECHAPVSLADVLARAAPLVEAYRAQTRHVGYEEKGILFSEMFFVYAAIAAVGMPRRVLESGRARGQSTYLLGACLPACRIVSVEYDRNSPDVPVAERRLAALSNVELLFGDALAVLPARIEPGDMVVIDGPKDFRGLRLALRLLRTGRPTLVFMHDVYQGSPVRAFVERYLPEAFCSDAPAFVEAHRELDEPCWQAIRDQRIVGWQPYRFEGCDQASYGPTFVCIPRLPGRWYGVLLARLAAANLVCRLRRSVRKRFG